MRTRRLLLVISAAQLSVGVASQFVAIHQGRSFEIFRWHGDPKRVAQDSWFMGTGLSAPVDMMAVHAAAIAILAARPSRRAAGTLGTLGATMAVGYLIENKFRSAIRLPAHEPLVTALGGVGFILAVAMAIIGARSVGIRNADRLAFRQRGRRLGAITGEAPDQADDEFPQQHQQK